MNDETNQRRVRRSSDSLLEAVDELKAAELRKRQARMSTPEFHRLADEVYEKTRLVWRAAQDEDIAGEEFSGPQDVTTDEVSAEEPA